MHLFAAAAAALQARQTVDEDLPPSFDRDDDDYYHWWYSREGRIVKWSLFLAFFLLLMGYLIGGYLHAKRRLKKGLLPLAYHRWMVRRAVLAQNMPPPPPMYDPSSARPPMYVPPEGGSKQQPQQPQQTGVATNTTGNTNPFLDRPQA
ncbi:hypothetical protein VdG1_03162 [Verticillium dahliae VDG1]|nr:hypothetical protein VdG1_03162 [Verticillium dahliae VDG1]